MSPPLPVSPSPRRYDLHACLALCLLAAIFLHPVIQGRVLLPGDALLLMHPWRDHGPEKFPELYQGGRFVPHNVLLDPIQQYYPWRKFATESMRDGIIPLWNPYNFCGYPFVANGQSSVFYPMHFLFFLFGVEYGFGVSALVHLCLLGCATYGFLRQLRLREIACFVGAVTFMFCGFNVVWLEYPTVSVWTMTWLPVALLCFERSLLNSSVARTPFSPSPPSPLPKGEGGGKSGDSPLPLGEGTGVKANRAGGEGAAESGQRGSGGLSWSLVAGLALGFQFLAGHLQSGFYVLFCFSTYALFRILTVGRDARPTILPPRSSILNLLLPLAIAFAVGAIQLLPSLELIGFNPRAAGKRYEDVVASALPLRQLITLIAPNFFGSPVHGGIYWGHFNYIELTGYAGVVSLMLALVAISGRRTPATWFFFGLAIFSLLIATGSPVYRLLFMLPGFKQVAAVGRILVLFGFAIAVLAAMGMQHLMNVDQLASSVRRSGVVIGLIPLCALASAVTSSVAWTQEWARQQGLDDSSGTFVMGDSIDSSIPQAAFIVMVAGIIVVRGLTERTARIQSIVLPSLVIADLFFFGLGFNPNCPRDVLLFPSKELRSSADELRGRRIVTFVPGTTRKFVEILPPNTNMLFGLRSAQGSDSLFPRWYADLFVRSGAGVLERNPANLDPQGQVFSLLAVENYWVPPEHVGNFPSFNRLPRAYTTELQTTDLPIGPVDWGLITPASVETDLCNQVSVEPSINGHLVLADTYFPGWRAYAGTEQLRIERAFHALRAVPARKGTIAFVYLPTVFRVGAFITMLTLAAMTGWWVSRGMMRSDEMME